MLIERIRVVLFLFAFGVVVATAQETFQNGTIFGTISDESSAAVAGATVEISSPALQVGTMTTKSDPSGSYRFSNLPTGVYRISYSMQGFQTDIRNNFTLAVGFSARVDVVMKVGSIEQSVEVSGVAPVIDVTTTTTSSTLGRTTLDDIPTTRSIWQAQYMAPGVRPVNAPDVGGSQLGTQGGGTNYGISGLITPLLDGINTQQNATATGYFFDYDSLQEVQIIPIGNQADVADIGITTVTVMKSGGNELHGSAHAFGEWQGVELNNAGAALAGKAGNPMVYFYDFAADVGGPIKKDRLWFYIGWHDEYRKPKVIGFVGPDGKQGFDPLGLTNDEAKGTYQATKNVKIIGVYARQLKYEHAALASQFRPYGTTEDYPFYAWVYKGEVVWTPTSRLVVDIMAGRYWYSAYHNNQPGTTVAGNPWTFNNTTQLNGGPVIDTGSSFDTLNSRYQNTLSASYFPGGTFWGRHSLQFGYQLYPNTSFTPQWDQRPSGSYELIFTGNSNPGTPFEINTFNFPIHGTGRESELGVYIKDNWQIGSRLTLNLGLRYDRYHVWNDAEHEAAGQFVPAQDYPAINVLTWNRVVPRVGLVFDPFGKGKTVFRASYGQYDYHTLGGFDLNFNADSILTSTYSWNGPCVATPYTSCNASPATLASLVPTSSSFITASGGLLGVVNPKLTEPVYHSLTAGIEHEVVHNLSIRALYVYNIEEHEVDQYNIARPLSDYNIVVPKVDPQTGKTINIYTYPAAYAGFNFIKYEWFNRNGDADFFHTVEFTATKRMSSKWSMLASFDLTKNHTWITQSTGGEAGNLSSAARPLTPNQAYFGLNATWDWVFKASGTYDLPYGLRLSAFYNYLAGTPNYRTVLFTGIPQLGSVTVPVEPYGSERNPPINLLNLRLGKIFAFKERYKIETTLDVFNVFNSNAATSVSYLTGPTYKSISAITPPLIARLGAMFSF
jgi:hypothetical protein